MRLLFLFIYLFIHVCLLQRAMYGLRKLCSHGFNDSTTCWTWFLMYLANTFFFYSILNEIDSCILYLFVYNDDIIFTYYLLTRSLHRYSSYNFVSLWLIYIRIFKKWSSWWMIGESTLNIWELRVHSCITLNLFLLIYKRLTFLSFSKEKKKKRQKNVRREKNKMENARKFYFMFPNLRELKGKLNILFFFFPNPPKLKERLWGKVLLLFFLTSFL